MEEGFDKKTLLKADEKKSLEDEGISMTSGYESSYEVSRSWEASLSNRSEWQSTNKQHEEIVNLETKLHQKLANIGELNQKEVLLLEDIKKIAEEKKNLKEIEKEYKKQLECWMKKNANLDRALQQLELLASNFDITFENGVSYIVKDDQRMEVDSIFAKITYARRLALSEIYPNSSVTKSKALIINNDFSESEDPRTGTEVDEKNLQMLFENLNYDVLLEKNASAKKMLEFIKLHAESSEQANCDSFIVTILTHGDDGVVFGSDYKPIAISEIIKCANTEVLGEKPKIFIIQACRGKLHDRGIKETKTPTPYAVNQTNKIENSKEKEFEIIEQKKANVDFNFSSYFSSNDSSSSQKYADQEKETDDLRSSHADICLIYPTWPSHVAFRDTNGSWLIKSIYREFSKNAHLKSLQEMLIAVNSYVQEKCAESGTRNERTTIASYLGFKKEKITVNGPLKQTSCYNSSMGKFFYFSSANKKLE
uniref:Caspase-3 n=1 Tax=Acrobeloides nanus TaxID=290746 RepID=A0A914C9J9_9BILA